MSEKQFKTGDIVMSRIYNEDGVDMVEVITIIFKKGQPINEEVNHLTLKEFNSAMVGKQNEG